MRPLGLKLAYAHRVSWQIHRGPIPTGLHVLHKCDNPACVNPDHLFLGSDDDNREDKLKKKRQPRGATHWNTKLSEKDVRSIRADTRRYRAIAAEYSIHPMSVGDIKRRKSWAHI